MIALDLFAGTGWGVACQRLGIEEVGVEIMPEARATRAANGMFTLYEDVWEGLVDDLIESRGGYAREAADDLAAGGTPWRVVYELLIASPPCQTFSMAGGGAGRRALDDVLGLIRSGAYHDPARLRAFGETHDPRTALVLTPLAHVARDLPLYVVFEQVPPVLPVWEACADEMRRWGYSVWTGIVNAEQYGVPQTRRRAILIARADGKDASPPRPTHSRYYSREPLRLDEGVLPWVSMAEALGWGMTERPMITAGNAIGRAEGVGGSGGKAAIEREKGRGAWIGNQYPEKAVRERQRRDADLPVPTISSGSRSAKIERGTAEQVRTGMGRGMIERHGERPGRDVADPAFTVLGGDGGNSQPGFGVREVVGFARRADGGEAIEIDGERYRARDLRDTTLPAQHLTEKARSWTRRPATTIAGDSRVHPGGHKVNADDERRLGEDEARERYVDRRGSKAERVTVAEAALLQSYPADFDWNVDVADPKTGKLKPVTKTKQFLQIGNAVPPLMAEAILREVLS